MRVIWELVAGDEIGISDELAGWRISLFLVRSEQEVDSIVEIKRRCVYLCIITFFKNRNGLLLRSCVYGEKYYFYSYGCSMGTSCADSSMVRPAPPQSALADLPRCSYSDAMD